MKGAISIFLAFFAAGLVFSKMNTGHLEKKEAELLPEEWYSPLPNRRLRNALEFEGMTCTTCHSEPLEANPKDKGEFHDKIKLEHADSKMNRHCFNCHNNKNFDTFIGEGSQTIAYKNVAQLCSKCHGPIYRDWRSGAHGRRSGYWNTKMGEQKVLQCIACHDPHSPVFKPMKPAGAPRRLHEVKHEVKHEAQEGHDNGH